MDWTSSARHAVSGPRLSSTLPALVDASPGLSAPLILPVATTPAVAVLRRLLLELLLGVCCLGFGVYFNDSRLAFCCMALSLETGLAIFSRAKDISRLHRVALHFFDLSFLHTLSCSRYISSSLMKASLDGGHW